MDHHQHFFSLWSCPYVFKIKKHFFVSFIFLLSLLIFSSLVIVINLSSFEPLLRFGLFSSSSSQSLKKDCDYSKGRWVRRTSSSSLGLLYGEDCGFLDPGFRCRKNGRKDSGYLQWRWQPHGCDLPR